MGNVVGLTVALAGLTTLLLLVLATPLAWWLARSRFWPKEIIAALAALPIVLPPTVLGFYLLIALAPSSPLMALFRPFGVRTLAFTVSAAAAGLGGGLFAVALQTASPGSFSLTLSLTLLSAVVIGGLGSLTGAVVGSVIVVYLSIELQKFTDRSVPMPESISSLE